MKPQESPQTPSISQGTLISFNQADTQIWNIHDEGRLGSADTFFGIGGEGRGSSVLGCAKFKQSHENLLPDLKLGTFPELSCKKREI
jgi:hypothetical protein